MESHLKRAWALHQAKYNKRESASQLARRAGVSRGTVVNWLDEIPPMDTRARKTLMALCGALGCEPGDIAPGLNGGE